LGKSRQDRKHTTIHESPGEKVTNVRGESLRGYGSNDVGSLKLGRGRGEKVKKGIPPSCSETTPSEAVRQYRVLCEKSCFEKKDPRREKKKIPERFWQPGRK